VFGDGIGDMAASLGCEVRKISLPFNESMIDLNRLEEAARAFAPKMITAVHCETPSGTINPLHELGRLKKDLGIPLLYVDAVASVGGMPVEADKCHVDLLLGAPQKCLSAPPSLCFMAVSEAAWEIAEKVQYQGYDALLPFKAMRQEQGLNPYTPYWHGLAALNAAAGLLLDEGLKQVYQRHERVARQCREGLARLNIALWPAANAILSPTVTAAMVPSFLPWEEWYKRLRDRGLGITGSFGPMQEKVFRLGHMGSQADEVLMDKALAVIEDALKG
jgi:aspartate aminotransferase-like enzyme